MSLYVLRSSLFDLSPRVWVERGHLFARSSWLLQALTLFAFASRVHVDGSGRVVHVDRRYLWFFRRSRSIRFARIRHLTYRFSRMYSGWSAMVGPTDQWESFEVGLALRDPHEELPLLRFRGLGSIGTGMAGVLFGDQVVDTEGMQQSTSLAFLELLQRLIGVGLGEPLAHSKDSQQRGWHCESCRRPGPPRPGACLYCGGPRGPG